MAAQYAIAFVAVLASGPVLAERLDPDAAQRFIFGKQFAFACFDGSRGDGRVYGDGSVIGVPKSAFQSKNTGADTLERHIVRLPN